MKTFIIQHEQLTQLVMQPETPHDKRVLAAIGSLPNATRTRFIQGVAGGYVTCEPFQAYYGNSGWDANPDVILTFPVADLESR